MKGRINSARYARLTAVAAVTAVVLALAWPRFLASFRYLPVDHAIQRYFNTHEIPSDRLPVLIRFARQSNAIHDHYRYHDGLSLLHWLRAVDVNTPALERVDEYRTAEKEAMESLRSAPAQPAVWLRIANIRWILHDEPEAIIAPWKMSIFTGRTDASLLTQRVEIGLVHCEYMDPEALAMLRDHLLLTWRLQPGPLMGVLARRDRNLALTRNLIQDSDPRALTEMEAWLEKLR